MVFWGSVNPLERRGALDLMARQAGAFGAKAFNFYNVRYNYGAPFPWRMDDPRVAFPVFEKVQELDVNLIGVHNGVPLGPQPVEATQTGTRPPRLGHGRRGGRLPRHRLRDLPRRAAAPRRDVLAAHPPPEPCTPRSQQRSTSSSAPPDVHRDPRQAAPLVRGRQDRLRVRGPDLATAVGAGTPSGTSPFLRTCARATATRSSPTRPSGRSSGRSSAEDPRGEPATAVDGRESIGGRGPTRPGADRRDGAPRPSRGGRWVVWILVQSWAAARSLSTISFSASISFCNAATRASVATIT